MQTRLFSMLTLTEATITAILALVALTAAANARHFAVYRPRRFGSVALAFLFAGAAGNAVLLAVTYTLYAVEAFPPLAHFAAWPGFLLFSELAILAGSLMVVVAWMRRK